MIVMKPFKRNRKTDTGSDRKKFGGRDFRKTTMFSATCSQCGSACEVPFKPNGKKPILCDNCFKRAVPNDQKRFRGPNSDTPRFNDRRVPREESSTFRGRRADTPGDELRTINAKLDAILRLLS
ncbi:hypothetical protein HYV71_00890 [Candidatus Uhrbacteria bacterium]|nr:hypothetical protein [Candidatus Uhrbacteria bacterium]